jgi:hypothetical protein
MFCREAALGVLREIALNTAAGRCRRVKTTPNLLADTAVFVVEEML